MNIKIDGMVELAGQMEKLKTIPQGEAVRQALLRGAELVSAQARANAPIAPSATNYKGTMISPGGLRKSIKAAPGRAFKNFMQAFAFAEKLDAMKANFSEFGVKKHTISSKDGKRLRFGKGGGDSASSVSGRIGISKRIATSRYQFARIVRHPGSIPTKFFSRAVKTQRLAVKRLLESSVKAAFDALGMAR